MSEYRQPPEGAVIMAVYNATGYGKLTTDDGKAILSVLEALGYEVIPARGFGKAYRADPMGTAWNRERPE